MQLSAAWEKKNSDLYLLFIHDVGAGGLSNALPELIKDSKHGGKINVYIIAFQIKKVIQFFRLQKCLEQK